MRLAIISPPSMLWWCGWGDHIHMALAQGVLNEAGLEYRVYFRARSMAGDYVILDNGAAEGDTFGSSALNIAAGMIKAKEVVVPDVLNNAQLTMEYGDAHLSRLINGKMIVPHGNTIEEWENCARYLLDRGTVQTIGLPKWSPIQRNVVLDRIAKLGWHTELDVHLLGLQGPPDDIKYLARDYPWIRSVDTGAPIAYAQHANYLTQYHEVGHRSLDWNGAAIEEQDPLARYIFENIKLLKSWCHPAGAE